MKTWIQTVLCSTHWNSMKIRYATVFCQRSWFWLLFHDIFSFIWKRAKRPYFYVHPCWNSILIRQGTVFCKRYWFRLLLHDIFSFMRNDHTGKNCTLYMLEKHNYKIKNRLLPAKLISTTFSWYFQFYLKTLIQTKILCLTCWNIGI